MLILQIESSSELCSVALSRDGKLSGMEINVEPFQHGRDINILIEKLLGKNSYVFSDLEAVSVNKGPGSYTALRIGMATAKGLCYGLDIPLVAPSGLEILVDYALKKYPDMDYYIPVIDARRMEVYTTDPLTGLEDPLEGKAMILDDNSFGALLHKRVCFIGNGLDKWKNIWPEDNRWKGEQVEIDAAMMCGISHRLMKINNYSDLFTAAPLYIKKPNITTSKKEYFN